MASAKTPQLTDFTVDILGRYMGNGLDEALHSIDKNAQRPDGTPQSDARPFNAIIIGGGSFGGVLAQHLLYADKTNHYRILVLEAGRHSLPEHFQNLPLQSQPSEVWGLAWKADPALKYPGLAYTIGGRSLFFGGWSPRLLDEEMPAAKWPGNVVNALKTKYFDEAGRQIGTDATNDFVDGELHRALRKRLADGIKNNHVRHAIPLNQLPLHLSNVGSNPPDILKLEAPLAVHGKPPLPGFFPINKFSSAPLLMEASRVAQNRSGGDDVKKRLMIVPDVHVTRLVTGQRNGATVVTAVLLKQFGVEQSVPVPEDGVVIIALGTIESTRLARISFPDLPNTNLIGQNLLAHLRSNLTIRIPRSALPSGLPAALQCSALFVKGKFQHSPGDFGYFQTRPPMTWRRSSPTVRIMKSSIRRRGRRSRFSRSQRLRRLRPFCLSSNVATPWARHIMKRGRSGWESVLAIRSRTKIAASTTWRTPMWQGRRFSRPSARPIRCSQGPRSRGGSATISSSRSHRPILASRCSSTALPPQAGKCLRSRTSRAGITLDVFTSLTADWSRRRARI